MAAISVTGYLLCLLFGLAVCKLSHWWWTTRHFRQIMSQYPGPKSLLSKWMFRGFLYKFNGLKLNIEFQRCYKSKNICLWVFQYPALATSDPVVISQICSSPALQKKSIVYTHIKNDIDGGLIFISGDEWRHHRKGFNPAFKIATVMYLIKKFNTAKDIAISEINKMADGMEHNLDHFFQYLSATTAFDSNFKTVLPMAEVYNYINKFSYCSRRLEWRSFMKICNLNFINNLDRQFCHNLSACRQIIEKVLKEQMVSASREDAKAGENSDNAMKQTPKVFVDQCIDLMKSNELSYDDVVSESLVILFATYETTSFTMFSVLVMLAMHPEVQERVFEEIVNIFPEKDFAVEYEHIQELKYLDMVINETMRVCPPVPYILRDVTENTPLKDGLMLPKGFQVLIFIYNLHRDEDLWGPNAGLFNPDHFLPENIKNRNPHAFMPFSKGARNCIGWRYAPVMMKTVLAGLIRNFKFCTDYKFEDLKFNNSITMFHVEVPLLKIQRRT